MIKRLLMVAALAAALRISGLLPFETRDVAQLKPVEALVVSEKEGQLVLNGGETAGNGTDWEIALEDLRQGAEGTLFLGTAEQIVLCGGAKRYLRQIADSEAMRPAAVVVWCPEETLDPKEVSAYLSAHDAGLTLQRVRAAFLRGESVRLPVLVKTEGGLRLHGTEDR